MNTHEIAPGTKGDLRYYVAFALPLTLLTVWIIIAFQSRYLLPEMPFIARLGWPWFIFKKWWNKKHNRNEKARQVMDRTIKEDYDDEVVLKGNDSWA